MFCVVFSGALCTLQCVVWFQWCTVYIAVCCVVSAVRIVHCSVLCGFEWCAVYIAVCCVVSVVRCALSLLVSMAYSCTEIQGLQSATPDLTAWLKRLTLEAPEVKH